MKSGKVQFLFGVLFLIASCGSEGHEDDATDNHEETNEQDTTQTEESVEVVENHDIYFTKIEKHKIPDEVKYEGKVVDANSWDDSNGKNYFVRTLGPIMMDQEFGWSSQYLYAYHYTENDGNFELVKETSDFVKDCEFDLIMSHVPTAITLTDLDGDNIGEVTFVYRKACTSDVSGSDQKLIMLENGEKYPLRGVTEVQEEGGDYEVGKEFNDAPEAFLEHAKKIWEENRTEYDFEL